MSSRLDSDVRVSDGGGCELAQSTEVEAVLGCDTTTLLNRLFQLLENGVLEDRVDDQHKSWQHTREESHEALILDDSQKRADGAGAELLGLCSLLGGKSTLVALVLAGCHASVDDPDGVGDEHGCASSNRTSDHALQCAELASVGTVGSLCSLDESSTGPFVPVVVDKVGNTDAEKSRLETCVKTADTFASDDFASCCKHVGVGFLGFDLSAC